MKYKLPSEYEAPHHQYEQYLDFRKFSFITSSLVPGSKGSNLP